MSGRMIRGLTLAALLLPAALILAPAQAQPGRGGRGGGGIGGMPGGMGGGAGGNIQGGMGGRGIGGGGVGGGGIGGMGPGAQQDEWVCSRCGAVIGHGRLKPAWSRCPTCGAKFTDGPDDDAGAPGGVPAGPPAAAPANQAVTTGDNRAVLIGVTVGVGLLVLLAAGGAVAYFCIARNGSSPKARRPRQRAPRKRSSSTFPDDD